MKKRRIRTACRYALGTVLIGCLLVILVKPLLIQKERTPVEKHGGLSVRGSNIVDENGEIFILQGVSLHTLERDADDQLLNEKTLCYIRDHWKVNAIRIAVPVSGANSYSSSTSARLRLMETVQYGIELAGRLGLYVIVDWHVLEDGNPLRHEKEARHFFGALSEKYPDQDNILYEICNEPNGVKGSWTNIKKYAEEVIPVIRENSPEAVIIVGMPEWSSDPEPVMKQPLRGMGNIVYSYHFYAATHKEDRREALKKALRTELPVLVTEFGLCSAYGNGEPDMEEGERWLALLDQYAVGRICYGFFELDTGCALLRKNAGMDGEWNEESLTTTGKWLSDFYNSRRIPEMRSDG